uniref:Arginine--tRNA ligase n=1 Tax=Candidatus Kentrum eta TaxID=2126337 RepID=A0A450VEA6_9GAMM|nr:MAG: arginyl-tRNA synthetase [Candidatus Kentron sp. H]VFJ97767.1 MAG: arginyl-tRNA synthetase [Candidatus Kentron sp. H]VFK03100.1 MAG: arginyl-tRNA synthetase [Candidatus Kentron sp. H]
MKRHLQNLLQQALTVLWEKGELPLPGDFSDDPPQIPVERTRNPEHGDFASPVCLALAKTARRKPREIAERVVASLPHSHLIERVGIAGPGFINFHIRDGAFRDRIGQILAGPERYGDSDIGAGQRVQIEYVSANPTGPLHVGHGRGAAYGAALAALLTKVGFQVHREYYVNDAGRQMDILALSVWLRYLALCGDETIPFPNKAYQGDYIWDIAATLHREHGEAYRPVPTREAGFPTASEEADPEGYLDALIRWAKDVLGEAGFEFVHGLGLGALLDDIRGDLKQFGVVFEEWFSERALVASGAVEEVLARLREAGYLYEKEGAWWFRSTDFGDEKDRVVIRDNGFPTYFASDIAYHANKKARGFHRIIDIWGADHHGYVARVKASMTALDEAEHDSLTVLLVQFANLYRDGKLVQMSTRSGDFVTLRELRQEVGMDAARFFYVMRRSDQHLDFDLDLAKSRTADNPVYYVQYAHARVCSLMEQLGKRGLDWDAGVSPAELGRLTEHQELKLLRTLSGYPEVVESAAFAYEPHQLAFFLRELATDFHAYYNAYTFLVADTMLRNARLALAMATRHVLKNGLTILGVSAPESM